MSASFSVGTFTNILNSSLLDNRENSNTYKTYLQQVVALEKKDITVKICPVFILGNTDLLGSFSLNKKFLLSIASSVCRQWIFFVFSYQSPCRQVDMLAFSYLFCVMIKTLRFPRILFVSDAGHFWYVAALKIGPIGGCFFYFSYSRVFLSLNGLLLTFLFICLCFVLQCSKPMEKGHCPDCKKVIGGEQHRFLGEYRISDR